MLMWDSYCCAGDSIYPDFLSKNWFQFKNASALRYHIRDLILKLSLEQKRLSADHPTTVNAVADRADYQEKSDPK